MGWRSWVTVVALTGSSGCLLFDTDLDGVRGKDEVDFGLDPRNDDSDADGIEDGEELNLGLDPSNADTDGDHLLDGDEEANGTDPFIADTDGDNYLDGDEVLEGKDPTDPSSVIYQGGWPYYYAKDELTGGQGAEMKIGKRFRRLQFKDTYGDVVDLWDFYNADKPVVIDISGQWCTWCNWLAEYLATGSDPTGDFPPNYGLPDEGLYAWSWPDAPVAIAQGKVYWITIMDADSSGPIAGTATVGTCEEWDEAYPMENVPCLVDRQQETFEYTDGGGWPTTILLTPDLLVRDLPYMGSASMVLSTLAEEIRVDRD